MRYNTKEAEHENDIHDAYHRIIMEDSARMVTRIVHLLGEGQDEDLQQQQHQAEDPLVDVPVTLEIAPGAETNEFQQLLECVVEHKEQVVIGQTRVWFLQGTVVADLQLHSDEDHVDDGNGIREISKEAMSDQELDPLQPAPGPVQRQPPTVLLCGLFGDKIKNLAELEPVETLGVEGLQLVVHLGDLFLGDLRLLQEPADEVLTGHLLHIHQPRSSLLQKLISLLGEKSEGCSKCDSSSEKAGLERLLEEAFELAVRGCNEQVEDQECPDAEEEDEIDGRKPVVLVYRDHHIGMVGCRQEDEKCHKGLRDRAEVGGTLQLRIIGIREVVGRIQISGIYRGIADIGHVCLVLGGLAGRTREHQQADHGKDVKMQDQENQHGEDLRQSECHCLGKLLHDGG